MVDRLNVLVLRGKLISNIRSVIYHMESHGITCHTIQVNAPRHNHNQTGRYSIYLLRRDRRLDWPWCFLCTELFYLSTFI